MASKGTGVVIGSHSARAVEVRKKGSVVQVTRVASLRLDPSSGDPLRGGGAGAITASLAAEKLRPGPAFLGLSGKDLVMRYTQVPPVPDWKLDTLMRFEIDEVSQQSGGDVSADYAVMNLPAEASPDSTVLVAMVKNSLLEPRVDVLKSLRLNLGAAVPNSLVLFNAFLWYGDVKPGETTLLVRMGGQNLDIAIQKDGNLLFARNVSGGGDLFTQAIASAFSVSPARAEKMKLQKGNVTPKATARYADSAEEKIANAIMGVAGQVLSSIQSSIMFARAQTRLADLSVERIVLAGGGANLRGLREYLETNIGLPVTVFDPLPALDLSPLSEGERRLAESDPAGLAVAIGAATMAVEGGGAFWVEILPESVRKRREFVRGPLFAILAGCVLAVLVVILFYTRSRDHGARAEALKKHNVKLSADVRTRATGEKRQEAVKDLEVKHAKIREVAALNVVIAKSVAAVQKHLVDEITLPEVRTVWMADPIKRTVGRGSRKTEIEIPREVPYLHVKGTVKGNKGPVWTKFIVGLKSEPGIQITLDKMSPSSGMCEFRIGFPEQPPEPEPEGDGIEGDGDGEGR